MENKSKLNLRRVKINQFGLHYVYKDIEKQAEIMEKMYNLRKFKYFNSGKPVNFKIKYRGKDSYISIKLAMNQLFNNIGIELIQWIDGECPYKEFLDQGKEGLHHIAIASDDARLVIDDFKKKGIEALLEIEPPISATYLDTEESLGIIIEIMGWIQKKT